MTSRSATSRISSSAPPAVSRRASRRPSSSPTATPTTTGRLPYRGMARSNCTPRATMRSRRDRPVREERGFTLIEVMICTLILTTGLLAIAGLLGVSTQMQIGAREAARSMRLAQEKVDQLMKQDFDTDAAVAVGGSLTENSDDH